MAPGVDVTAGESGFAPPRRIVLAMTGASAMPVARKMLEMLASAPGLHLSCIVSKGAEKVWEREGSGDLPALKAMARTTWDVDDSGAGPASGSWWRPAHMSAMIVLPCSMGTLGALAAGYTANLVHRACAVALKEGVKLVVVPRETPLSAIALRNMQIIQAAGAVVMPFCPGFYFRPQTLEDMCEQFCCRVLEQIGIQFPCPRWDSVLP